MSIDKNYEAVTYQINSNSMRLNKAYCMGPLDEMVTNYLFFNNNFEDIVFDPEKILVENMMCRLIDNAVYKVQVFDKYSLDEHALDFTKYNLENKKILLVFNLYSTIDRCVLIRLGGRHIRAKVWINKQLIFSDRLNNIDIELLLFRLIKGNNIVLVEIHEIAAFLHEKLFSFYTSDYVEDMKKSVLSSFYEREINNKIRMIQKRWDFDDRFLEFIVIQKDFIHVLSKGIVINIRDNKEHIIEKMDAQFGQVVKFDTDSIPYNKNDFLYVDVEYLAENSAQKQRFVFLMSNAPNHFLYLCERFNDMEPSPKNLEYALYIQNWIQYINKLRSGEINVKYFDNYSILIYLHDVHIINHYFDMIENDVQLSSNEKTTYFFSFFNSKLDNALIRYDVKLPDKYSQDEQYPLLIYIPNGVYEEQVIYCLDQNMKADIIITEISCRGMTFGSYIGESAFFECMHKILETYAVDRNKIYLMGSCSGAYAALLLAQCFPDLFAGIVVSNGEMDMNKAMNLSNVPIYNLCTELSKKLNKVYIVQSDALKSINNNYVEQLFDISQDSLTYMIYNTHSLVDWLQNYNRNDDPIHIYYQSYYSRHHRCFWCDVLQRADRNKECMVEGKLFDGGVDLKLQNVVKLRITLTENKINQLTKINVNDGATAFTIKVSKSYIEIELKGHGDSLKDTTPIDMGMLQIYMDSLKIVIPSDFHSEQEKKNIHKLATLFSKPKSSGYEPDIYVEYPIIECTHMKEPDYIASNLILIGDAYHWLPDEIKNTLPIHFRENSFEYKGYHKNSKYYIMYIHPNKLNKKNYILLVYANDPLLYRNIYTRRIVIPTYLNSMQSDYGNVGIIYDGTMYYYIKETGDDIVKLASML